MNRMNRKQVQMSLMFNYHLVRSIEIALTTARTLAEFGYSQKLLVQSLQDVIMYKLRQSV